MEMKAVLAYLKGQPHAVTGEGGFPQTTIEQLSVGEVMQYAMEGRGAEA